MIRQGGRVVLIWRVVELLLLVIAVFAVVGFIAFSRGSGSENSPALFIASAIAVLCSVGVYLTDKRIKRLTEPKPITIPADFRGPLKIYLGKRRMMMLAGGAAMFLVPAPLMYESGKHGIAIASGIFGILFLLVLLSDLRKMGMPYLVLNDQGMTTHQYGRISWSEVDNASLHVLEHRGGKHYLLGLSVYDFSKYRQRLVLFQRLKRWMDMQPAQDELRISLNMLSHEPRYIEAVVKHFRALYARSIGVTPLTGDLSKDKKLSEIASLMNLVRSENNLEKLQSTTAKIDVLNNELDQEFRDNFVRIRKGIIKSSIYAVIGLVLIVTIMTYKFLSR
jgi:hypothetical protein